MVTETTALGAAYLAGLGAGLFKDFEDIARALGAGPPLRAGMRRRQRAMRSMKAG